MAVYILLLDGLGVGAQPDSFDFGDEGAFTLAHVLSQSSLSFPNLTYFGLLRFVPGYPAGIASGAKLQQFSAGKDTTSGHWELMGVVVSTPFPTYPQGFPPEVIQAFEEAIGRKVLGNKPASGTKIIEELGEGHLKTGYPIVYTSADSVFQIAAHEEVIPVEELYKMCSIARKLLSPPHHVARVIARPFIGNPGSFTRTSRRKDFSLPPPHPTLLDHLLQAGYTTLSIGKVKQIFAQKGFTDQIPTQDNKEGLKAFHEAIKDKAYDLVFCNLVDFDSRWGHRRNLQGFAEGLKEVDDALLNILEDLGKDDLLILTADHGCDPTYQGTDHTREYVPLLIYGSSIPPARNLGILPMTTLADTLADWFHLHSWRATHSLLPLLSGKLTG